MTNTERKLDEARFFLNQLNINDPYFDYILGAYLNAARSVTWIMKNEFIKIKRWMRWYVSKTLNDKEKTILKEINRLRIKSTKQDGIKTDFFILDAIHVDEKYYADVKKMFDVPDGTEFKITVAESHKKKDKDINRGSLIISGLVDMHKAETASQNRKKLSSLCKDYFKFLEQIVSECSNKFVNKK